MNATIYSLLANNSPLPAGTRIRTTTGGIPNGKTQELSPSLLESANRCPNHLSETMPFWVVGWTDLHESLIPPASVATAAGPAV